MNIRTESEGWSGQSQTSETVLNFRVDRFNDEGEPLPGLAVEMRGRKLRGSVNDGEWVEIPGKWREGELLEPRRVRNLTTGTFVEVKRQHRVLLTVVAILIFIGICAICGLIGLNSFEFSTPHLDSPTPSPTPTDPFGFPR